MEASNMKRPIDGVSVIIPTLNAMPYVQDAVRSILRQTYTNLEIIIVDGGSDDGTLEFVQGLSSADTRVRVIVQSEGGIGRARNIGIEEAKFDWIACLDADDIAYPQRIEKEVMFLNNHRDIMFVSCDIEYVDLAGRPTGVIKRHKLASPPYYDPYVDGNVPHQGALFSKTAVLSIGGYRDFPQGEDYDLFLRLSEHYLLGFLPEVLVGSRILSTGLTLKGFEEQRIYWMYARDCAKARRVGEEEPPLEYWLKSNCKRISEKRRKWKAQKLWTLAGASLTERNWLRAVGYAISALFLHPQYVMGKINTYKTK